MLNSVLSRGRSLLPGSLPILAKVEAGALLEHHAQIVELLRRHGLSPRMSMPAASAIPAGGSNAAQTPAAAAAPGMPHTTLEPSSWAITLPPASAMARAPAAPS